MKNTRLTIPSLSSSPVCPSNTSQCMLAPRAHVETCVRVVPVPTETFWTYARGRVGRTHGVFQRVTHHTRHRTHTTPQHKTQHNTTWHDHNTTRRQRQRETQTDRERQRKKTEKEDRERRQRKKTETEREEETNEKKTRQEKREERQEKREERREKREETFSVWCCMAVLSWCSALSCSSRQWPSL